MITFSFSLSMQAALILLSFDDWKNRGYDKNDTPFSRSMTGHFVTVSNKLIREGYLTHTINKQLKGNHNEWRITEKGCALASLIRLEMQDVGDTMKHINQSEVRRLSEKKT